MNHCASITHMDIRGNPLPRLPVGIAGMSCMVELNAINNIVEFIPDELFHQSVHTLERFWIPNSSLQKFPRTLYQCSQLIELDATNNKINEITSDIGGLTSLKYLYLSYNQIKKIPSSVSKLRELEICELHENLIKELPEGIGTLPKLYRLTIHQNKIKKPQAFLRDLPSLIGWDVSHNKYSFSVWYKADQKAKADAEKLEAAKLKAEQTLMSMAMEVTDEDVSLVGIVEIERGLVEANKLREEALYGKDKQHSVLDEPWDDKEPRDYEAKVRWKKAKMVRDKKIKAEKEKLKLQAQKEAAVMGDMVIWHERLYNFFSECIHEQPPDYPTEQYVLENKLDENAIDRDLMRTDEAKRTTRGLANIMMRIQKDNPVQDVKMLVQELLPPDDVVDIPFFSDELLLHLNIGQEFQICIDEFDKVLKMILECADSTRSVESMKHDQNYMSRLAILESTFVQRILTAATAKGGRKTRSSIRASTKEGTSTRGSIKTGGSVGSISGREPPPSESKESKGSILHMSKLLPGALW